MIDAKVFLDRRGVWAFVLGCVAVTIGVLLHLPMFWMGHNSGFNLSGMPMDPGMIFGMYLIVAGVAVAASGLLPSRAPPPAQAPPRTPGVAPDAHLSRDGEGGTATGTKFRRALLRHRTESRSRKVRPVAGRNFSTGFGH